MKGKVLRKVAAPSYTEHFLLVLTFNVTPCFLLKKKKFVLN